MERIRSLIENLSYSDESDLRKYIPKFRRASLPFNLRISSLDRVVQYFVKKGFSEIIYIVQCIILLMFLLLYIVSEYQEHVALYMVDSLLSIFYLGLLIIAFVLSDKRGHYICHPYTLLDFFTILSTSIVSLIDIVRAFIFLDQNKTMNGLVFWSDLPYFRLIRLLRLGALIQLYFQRRSRGKVFTGLVILICLGTITVVTSGIVILCENEVFPLTPLNDSGGIAQRNPLSFHNAAYMVLGTFTTVGYGDFVPHSIIGRAAICFFLILFFIALLGKTKEIYFIFSNQKVISYDHSQDMTRHIIMTGSASAGEIFEFWKEFFDEAHGKIYPKRIVVVIDDEKEYSTLRKLAEDSYFRERVTLICESITNFEVLSRLRVDRCSGIFVLVNSNASDPANEDIDTLMKVVGIKNHYPGAKIYAQHFLRSNSHLFKASGAKVAICIQNIEERMIGLNCYARGSASLLSNLIFTNDKKLEKRFPKKLLKENPWIKDFASSCHSSIYVVGFAKGFIGIPFHRACEYIYEHFDIVLLGIVSSNSEVLLNPYRGSDSYVVKDGDRAFIIAQSLFHSQAVSLCNVPDVIGVQKTIDQRMKIQNRNGAFATEKGSPRKQNFGFRHIYLKKQKEINALRSAVSKVVQIQNKNKGVLQNHQIYSAYFRDTPLPRESFFMKSAKHFSDHIVILVKDFHFSMEIGLYLRSVFISPVSMRPILFMINPSDKNSPEVETLFEEFSVLKDVHAIIGEIHSVKDLDRVAVSSAHSVFISTSNQVNNLSQQAQLSGEMKSGTKSHSKHQLSRSRKIVDSETIHVSLSLESISRNIHYHAAINDRRNINFFLRENSSTSLQSKSFFDFLQVPIIDSDFEMCFQSSKQCASGKIFSRTFFTRLLCQSYFAPEIVDIIDGMCGYHRMMEAFDNTHSPVMSLHLIQPDPDLAGCEYRDVYSHYLKKSGICVGLLRHYAPDFQYTYCNPPSFMKLDPNDLVYVVGNYEKITKPVRKADLEERVEYHSPSAKSSHFPDSSPASNRKYPIPAPSPGSVSAPSPLSSFTHSSNRIAPETSLLKSLAELRQTQHSDNNIVDSIGPSSHRRKSIDGGAWESRSIGNDLEQNVNKSENQLLAKTLLNSSLREGGSSFQRTSNFDSPYINS